MELDDILLFNIFEPLDWELKLFLPLLNSTKSADFDESIKLIKKKEEIITLLEIPEINEIN